MSEEHVLSAGAKIGLSRGRQLSRSADCVVDAQRQLVTVKFGKKLTFGDIERYAKLLQLNPSFQPCYSEIVDLTDVEELDLQAEEFLNLADKIDPFALDAKRAFVVRSSVQSHAARMHKALRTHRNIQIFHSADEAEAWIAS